MVFDTTMDKTILICAHNPKNAGMYSVDLAGKQLCTKNGVNFELGVTQRGNRFGSLTFKRIRTAVELSDCKSIIYWGDFQNNPMWGMRAFSSREVIDENSNSRESAFDLWKELYLNTGKSIPDKVKIHSIGGCFHGIEDYLDRQDVRESFEYFLGRAESIVVRDTHSLNLLKKNFSPDLTKGVTLGYDVASLLETNFKKTYRKKPYFVWSFGRSGFTEKQEHKIIELIADNTGLQPIKINWLNPKLLFKSKRCYHNAFMGMLKTISQARFVLTDIYHMSINSLNLGTPPIVIYKPDRGSREHGTLLDDKKRTLLEMLNAEKFLCHWADTKTVQENIFQLSTTLEMLLKEDDFYNSILSSHAKQKDILSKQVAPIIMPDLKS